MEIIDFHTHPFLEPVESIAIYDKTYTYNAIKEKMTSIGINHICGSVLRRDMESDMLKNIRKCNAHAYELKTLLDGFYTPGIHIHPDYVKESVDEIREYNDKGINLIGELVPYMHLWKDSVSEGYYEILEEAAYRNMIVSFHTMNDEDEMDKMVSDNPKVTFVMAHPGERDSLLRHIARMKKCDNVYLDLSGTGIFRYTMLKFLINEVGADRILFGSDYPVCNPGVYVGGVNFEDISDLDKEKIFSKNAIRLLNI